MSERVILYEVENEKARLEISNLFYNLILFLVGMGWKGKKKQNKTNKTKQNKNKIAIFKYETTIYLGAFICLCVYIVASISYQQYQ